MMDYEVFKKVVTVRIKEFLPPVYAEFEAVMERVPKTNGMKDALVIRFEAEGCCMSAPNIYFDELYEMFSSSGDMDCILTTAAMRILEFTGTQRLDGTSGFDIRNHKDKIIHMLINTEMNRELLELVPHRKFYDLSVVYRMVMPAADGTGHVTALITNELMEDLKLEPDELDCLAEENSRRNMKTEIYALTPDLTMMTTEAKLYGAVNLLRMDEIRKLADDMRDNLYLLPSSVHDLMVIRESGADTEQGLFELLKSGNDECNESDETLSYNFFYYNREEHTLELRCCNG